MQILMIITCHTQKYTCMVAYTYIVAYTHMVVIQKDIPAWLHIHICMYAQEHEVILIFLRDDLVN